jgi:hypothetical protein
VVNLDNLYETYSEQCPFAVLTQIAIRGLLGDLNDVFEANRTRQYEREAEFADIAFAVAQVALRFAGNFNQAYKAQEKKLGISRQCFYDKLKATELTISSAVVAKSAERATEAQEAIGFVPWQVLAGYRVFSIDGNHLQESEKRLKPLRDCIDAPLAGITVARLDHQRMLFDRAYLLEDAHAQECSTRSQIADDLEPGNLLMADRHFCLLQFFKDIAEAGAAFVIRQHGRFRGVLKGKRRKIGKTATGVVFEQEIWTTESGEQRMRRITIELYKPTKKGETEVHLLSNLPAEVDAIEIADLYLVRWEIETSFYHLTTSLTCELKSVASPKAALFLFCVAMMAFNIRQVLFAALYAAHDDEEVEAVSNYQISLEISQYTNGMLIVLNDEAWAKLIPDNMPDIAAELVRIASSIDLSRYKKGKAPPKKKKPKKPKPKRKKTHVSTAKLLRAAKAERP